VARLTPERDALVIRLVYDGAPRSGKTTSLGALAGGMARALFSPAEADGRTLYFDWLEYVGGSFEGMPIRCQIVSVPGQKELAARRFALLAEADAIVFVTNSSPGNLPEAAAHLRELREFLDSRPAPRPGVVVQANHRDRPDAVPLAALEAELGLTGLALVESVATENQGIRQAFVLSVRLALDRVRELIAQKNLPAGPGETEDPAALQAWLQAAEAGGLPPAPPRAEPAPESRAEPATESKAEPATESKAEPGTEPGTEPIWVSPHRGPRRPRLPDSSAPSGRVWPPIDGRIVLHSATLPGAVPLRFQDGSWRLSAGGWHFHSAPAHEFEQLDDAKQELLLWARCHVGGVERLSAQRCLTLADTGWGTWRLWQVVRAEDSLRLRLRTALRESAPDAAVKLLHICAARLLEARGTFALAPQLPCRLGVIGERQGRPLYIGLLPPPGWEPPPEPSPTSDGMLVRREIQPLFAAARGEGHWPDGELLAALGLPAVAGAQSLMVTEALMGMVGGS
jgi:signal recognition particle receptor subunit beta